MVAIVFACVVCYYVNGGYFLIMNNTRTQETRGKLASVIGLLKRNAPNQLTGEQLVGIKNAFGYTDQTLDTSYRGEGNASKRRQGINTDDGCYCVICTVYGGDCSYQMWKEDHSEWHRGQRGVKTRIRVPRTWETRGKLKRDGLFVKMYYVTYGWVGEAPTTKRFATKGAAYKFADSVRACLIGVGVEYAQRNSLMDDFTARG